MSGQEPAVVTIARAREKAEQEKGKNIDEELDCKYEQWIKSHPLYADLLSSYAHLCFSISQPSWKP